jgi:2'-5' RNA ligase
MHAIVTLFDRKNDELIRSLWKELERTFHVRGVLKTPYPHFSYQIASKYNIEKLEADLERISSNSRPFSVHAGGLGLFTGPASVLYIPVVRTAELSKFQESLWKKVAVDGSGISPYYEPHFWTPHVTLAQWDINEKNLPKIIGRLAKRQLDIEIKVDNLAVIFDDGKTQKIRSKFRFH